MESYVRCWLSGERQKRENGKREEEDPWWKKGRVT
jgi:hypothetical protein